MPLNLSVILDRTISIEPHFMQVEHRISTRASPAAIFAIYADVANWHVWDPDTKRAAIDGPFCVGTRGTLTPARGSTVPMLLTEVEPGRRFTVESRLPLFRMVFEHELKPAAGATVIVHRVTLSGPLKHVIGRTLIKQLNAGLPVTLERLKRLAEAQTVRAIDANALA